MLDDGWEETMKSLEDFPAWKDCTRRERMALMISVEVLLAFPVWFFSYLFGFGI